MDNFDTLSDCSESSRNSECLSSNVSTLSGLSEYQAEFLDLKQLVKLEDASGDSKSITSWYEKQISHLNYQLQKCSNQNEQYKLEIADIKRKDIIQNEKIDTLLKQNKQLEENVSAGNNQILRLLNACQKTKDNTDQSTFYEKNLLLEKSNHDLMIEIHLLSDKLKQSNCQKEELERQYTQLNSEFSVLNLELNAKTNIVNDLKKKISEQHVSLQDSLQKNIQLSHSLESTATELDCVKKSEKWYKSELHKLQQEKSNLFDTILKNEKVIASQNGKIEHLRLEINDLKCSHEKLRLTNLKEKEQSLKQIEFITQRAVCNNNTGVPEEVKASPHQYELIIEDLTKDVLRIKSDFTRQRESFEEKSNENTELLGQLSSLKNCLQDKENTILKLENDVADLKEKLSLSINRHIEQNSQILDLKQKNAKLEVEWNLKKCDNSVFTESINVIRNNFQKLKDKYGLLEVDLAEKNKQLSQLRLDVTRKEFELQKYIEKVEDLQQGLEHKNRELLAISNELHSTNLQKKNNKVNVMIAEVMGLDRADAHISSDRLDFLFLVDMLRHICDLFKLNQDDFLITENQHLIDQSKLKLLLHQLSTRFHETEELLSLKNKDVAELRKKLHKMVKTSKTRLTELSEKYKNLEERTEENANLLHSLCDNTKRDNLKDEVQYLRTLLQVKVKDAREKEKRYERNYRTLLRKVKEHLRGRRTAEKQNNYLQEMHNALSDECNHLKLQLHIKDLECKNLQERCEKSTEFNEKLKKVVAKFENELQAPCSNCNNLEISKKRELELEKCLKTYENSNTLQMEDLEQKGKLVEGLQKENRQLVKDNDDLKRQLITLEKNLVEEKSVVEQEKGELQRLELSHFQLLSENEQLKKSLGDTEEKNSHLVQEINDLNSYLQHKSEEMNELQIRKEETERRWSETNRNTHNLIAGLRDQLHIYKNEIDLLKNGKFSLQRLCNDLKVALTTQINHNKVYKEFYDSICNAPSKEKFTILSKFPSPVNCNDDVIHKLLQEIKVPYDDEPFCDIQECINTLRKEILFLQKQIVEKNVG